MSFLPDNYKVRKPPSLYMKFVEGDNKLRILDKPIIGEVYWTTENKPVHLKEVPTAEPVNFRKAKGKEDQHWMNSVKHFWAMKVWNYNDEMIQVLEITQASVQNPILNLFHSATWGDPKDYDLCVTRVEGAITSYSVVPNPKTPLSDEITKAHKDTPVNLDALYESGDPFSTEKPKRINPKVADPNAAEFESEETVEVGDLPF